MMIFDKASNNQTRRVNARLNPVLLRWSRAIHVYLSVALLVVLVFFAMTGITLNHADTLNGTPQSSSLTLDSIPELPRDDSGRISTTPELAAFLKDSFNVNLQHAQLRYEDEFLLIDYQLPGSSTIVEIDQDYNEAYMDHTDFGLIAALNDLHKGRHTDALWSLLIDASAVLLVLFALAGFILLLPNKRRYRKVLKYSVIGIAMVTLIYLLGNQL